MMSAPKRFVRLASLLGIGCAVGVMNARVMGVQHLVSPGGNWEQVLTQARPGDEVILMPGRHRPALINRLIGTSAQPITIRGLTSEQPAIIVADQYGIRIAHPAHLVIKDLRIEGASLCGLSLGMVRPAEPALGTAPLTKEDKTGEQQAKADASTSAPGNIQIKNVGISRIGLKGLRHAVQMLGLSSTVMTACQIEGWGGAGVEIVACREITIEQSILRGHPDHEQRFGIRVRAGTERVRIDTCVFMQAGQPVLCLGGASERGEFASRLPQDPKSASIAEAARVQVSRCLIIGGQVPFAFIHADDCIIRHNTIVRPRGSVFALRIEQTGRAFTPNQRNIFGSNLIVWEPNDLTKLAEVSEQADAERFILEENLWWSPEPPEKRQELGALPGTNPANQIMDVDPRLDERYSAENPQALPFGAKPPLRIASPDPSTTN